MGGVCRKKGWLRKRSCGAWNSKVSQVELDAIIGKYAYGYNVVAGRVNYRDETKNWQMAEQPVAMSDQCRPELLQMDRLIRRRQLKGFDVPAVLQGK
ncbi:MAG: hypothetical protein ACLUJR_11745 [Mediterraneibacter gnavus]